MRHHSRTDPVRPQDPRLRARDCESTLVGVLRHALSLNAICKALKRPKQEDEDGWFSNYTCCSRTDRHLVDRIHKESEDREHILIIEYLFVVYQCMAIPIEVKLILTMETNNL